MEVKTTKYSIMSNSKENSLTTLQHSDSRSLVKVEDCINSSMPSLAKIKRKEGEEKTLSFIKLELIRLNELLSLKRPMTETQIDFTAQVILDEFWMLNVSDLKLVFKNILTGKCGNLYESLNPPKTLSIFRDYLSERMNVGAEMSMKQHQEHKQF